MSSDQPTREERELILDLSPRVLFVESVAAELIEHGRLAPCVIQGGCTLELREATMMRYDRSRVEVYRPIRREADTARAWHDHCREHGYPIGPDLEAEDYPTPPVHGHEGEWVGLTWAAIRRGLIERARPQQLSLGVPDPGPW